MGGALDRLALRTANLLVGNDDAAAGLETVFLGPEPEFTEDAVIAVCGAELPPLIDGEEHATWTALGIRKGQVLSFGFLKLGARAHIAVSGGIVTPPALGSRSTYPIGSLGGVDGRAVQPDDSLPIGQPGGGARPGKSLPAALRRLPRSQAELRVLPALYWHRITEGAQNGFFDDAWRVANEADRMGYRFRGGRQLEFVPRESPIARARTPPTLSMRATLTDQFRFPMVPSPTCCTATRFRVAATSCWAPSFRRTWT